MAHQVHLHPVKTVECSQRVGRRGRHEPVMKVRSVGAGLGPEMVLGERGHPGIRVSLEHGDIHKVCRVIEYGVEVVCDCRFSRGSVKHLTPVGIMYHGRLACGDFLPPGQPVMVEIVDVWKLRVPDVVAVLVNVPQRVADVDVGLRDTCSPDELPQRREDDLR